MKEIQYKYIVLRCTTYREWRECRASGALHDGHDIDNPLLISSYYKYTEIISIKYRKMRLKFDLDAVLDLC